MTLSDKVLWRNERDDWSIPKDEYWAEVDEQGRLVLPAEVREHYGISPGARILLKENPKSMRLSRPITQLAKVYVEPTSRCNLTCTTCIRNAWDEAQGHMTAATWQRVLDSLAALPSRPAVFFGGFGEPLAHPRLLDMLEQVRPLAVTLELITNGMLLSEQVARRLIGLGLDVLWVSLDGATPEHYADVRLGAALSQVLENIQRFAFMRNETNPRPEVGISFVAMRKNIDDLPKLIKMSSQLGASRYMVTNVFPYTQEMCAEMLYVRSVDGVDSTPSPWVPRVDLPRIDLNPEYQDAIVHSMRYRSNVNINGVALGQDRGHCPFIERGSVAICWDGSVSPCLALMHRYQTFLHDKPRSVERHVVGNLNEQDLGAIWEQKDYLDFRTRVAAFDFSPCTWCGGCSWSEANQEDCFANPFPTCGGCLWAQGVIQCP